MKASDQLFAAELTAMATARAHHLPAATELDAFQAQAEARIFQDGTRGATRRAYNSALRYWDAWHRVVYGRPLPLLTAPHPTAVPSEHVRLFIVHHTPRRTGNTITTWMPAAVREALEHAGVLGERRVARAHPQRDQDQPATTPDGCPIAPHVPAIATVRQRVDLLAGAHTKLGLPSPTRIDPKVRALLAAARSIAADLVPQALTRKKAPLTQEDLQRLVEDCDDSLLGRRDRAMLLIAFDSGGRRRSELVSMDFEHLAPFEDGELAGYRWSLPRTKTSQRTSADGAAQTLLIVGRAALALDAWLDALRERGIDAGAVFRRITKRDEPGLRVSEREYVREVIVRRAQACLPHADSLDLAGHSMRSGFATEALKAGAAASDAMAMSGHRSLKTFMGYYHVATPTDETRRVMRALGGARAK